MGAKLTVVGKEKESVAQQSEFRPGLVTRSDGETLRYIEDKPLDLIAVGEFLKASEASNHWANFGPVSRQIEAAIAKALNLDESLRVVMCASGTAAMHGIINLHETLAEKDLRWVTSSFGYYSSIQGPLRNADVSDCDDDGMLDLAELDPTTFDGMVVTNTFGQKKSMDKYLRYAAAHGKILCVDAAMAFGSHQHGANECISFHHTKPWGFGEGGCAIVAAEHENLFRSIICFGHEPGEEVNRRASNGKISDVSCAFGMMRLQQMETLGGQYREQYRRIARIGRQVGLGILSDVDEHPGIPASVPFLTPLALEDFKDPVVPTGRYYHPLTKAEKAFDIYDRIVNVPCHPGMAKLTDPELKKALETFVSRCF